MRCWSRVAAQSGESRGNVVANGNSNKGAIVINLAVDLLYSLLDPRVRLAEARA